MCILLEISGFRFQEKRMQFKELIGQEAAINHVREAIRDNRLPHAIMLTGPAGVGKLAFANAIAQYLNCLDPQEGDSCGKCTNCVKIRKGIHPDVRYVLPIISKKEGGKQWLTQDYFDQFRPHFFTDPYFSFRQWQRTLGGENKQLFISVHEIRDLKRGIYLKAFEAPYKVVILWNAEQVNNQGANAFLKLLEEPPDKTIIIMTCSDTSKLLTTINSRCQQMRMGRINAETIQEYLVDQKKLDGVHAREIAAIAEGSMANAYEFLEESTLEMSSLYANWLRAAYTGKFNKIAEEIEKIYKENREFQKLFLTLAVKKIRDSLMYHLDAQQLALVTDTEKAFQEKFSQVINPQRVERIAEALEDSRRHISGNANPQMVFTSLSMEVHQILRSN